MPFHDMDGNEVPHTPYTGKPTGKVNWLKSDPPQKAKVLNNRDIRGLQTPLKAVYIGRGSMWGNPFVIGKFGTRDEVCDRYEKWLEQQIADRKIAELDIAMLHGCDLVCFCAPLRCHGDYLAKRAEEIFNEMKDAEEARRGV